MEPVVRNIATEAMADVADSEDRAPTPDELTARAWAECGGAVTWVCRIPVIEASE